jgi:hypothetical protein
MRDVIELMPWNSSWRANTEVLPSATTDPLIQAKNRSLYDSLVAAYENATVHHTCDSLSATAFAHNLVRSKWEEAVLVEECNFLQKLSEDFDQHLDYHGLSTTEIISEKENRTAKSYQDIIQRRMEMKEHRKRLEEIRHAWGAGTT